MTLQPVFVVGDEDVHTLEAVGFDSEEEFQRLLARHPRVLDFGSLADGRPLHLFLVAREMGVATGEHTGPTLALDHLFVDEDAVPTLVEVKRAGDTRIRREVVGQMLDYAANGARYWPAALLRKTFEDTCATDGVPLEQAYEALLGERTTQEFWAEVEERLAAGRMRLLFVADRIPGELRAVVEFLNRQLRQTDVYAVELTHYRGAGALRVLVPRVYGETAAVPGKSSSTATRRAAWSRDEIEQAVSGYPRAHENAARRLLEHASRHGRWEGGRGQHPSALAEYTAAGRNCRLWALTLTPRSDKARLDFSLGAVRQRLGAAAAAALTADLRRLPTLAGRLADAAARDYNLWPGLPLDDLTRSDALDAVLTALERLLAVTSADSPVPDPDPA
ncbi:hypothetical protein [Kitasatospora fiedleri]|uniref:hypothetical protein n=1 Tax=Kitasatospora fiedleri TaxID=2991545 RepID=UPI00249B0E90|nr:hypothetical protein [Kitasatospora fiedleri]